MDEDLELNRLVKLALESREPFRLASSCGAVRRPVLRWGVPSLLAATLALAAVFRTTLSLPSDRVSDAIRLLSAVEGTDLECEGESPAELLLAWQDAPCRDIP